MPLRTPSDRERRFFGNRLWVAASTWGTFSTPQKMKRFSFIILSMLGLALSAQAQQELPVGTQSEDVQFALLGGELTNASLTDFSGKIVVLYYYTPW